MTTGRKLNEITGYRVQEAMLDTADLLAPEQQYSHAWGNDEDEDDPRTRHGISACLTLEDLATYLATVGQGIGYGWGEWVIVEMYGPESSGEALDADAGEVLMFPERIVSVRPLDADFLAMVGAAFDVAAE